MIIYPYRYRYRKSKGVTSAVAGRPQSPSAPRLLKLIPPTLITLGSLLIANVLWPLISYQFFTAPSLQKNAWISPVAPEYLGSNTLASDLTGLTRPTAPQVLGMDTDYTQVSSWFPGADLTVSESAKASYVLDIPALKIEDALVVVGGQSLDQHLVHFPNTAQPGAYGTTVIFGHSVLRQFYQPQKTNPRRYISIFSKIMTLKTGERIYLDHQGVIYTYEVIDKYEVEPEEISVLEQRLDTKELKLITCVPEGTYLRRGVVVARMVDLTLDTETNVLH